MAEPNTAKKNNQNDSKKILPIEWVISSIGFLIFILSFGYILYEAITYTKTPPSVKIKIESITEAENSFVVQIEVENNGTSTAEGLEVEGQLNRNDSTIEKTNTLFDYVPGKSKRKGGLIFQFNPKEYNLEVHALGYEEP